MRHSENIASSFVLTEPDFPLYSFAATDNDLVSESTFGYDIHMPSMMKYHAGNIRFILYWKPFICFLTTFKWILRGISRCVKFYHTRQMRAPTSRGGNINT